MRAHPGQTRLYCTTRAPARRGIHPHSLPTSQPSQPYGCPGQTPVVPSRTGRLVTYVKGASARCQPLSLSGPGCHWKHRGSQALDSDLPERQARSWRQEGKHWLAQTGWCCPGANRHRTFPWYGNASAAPFGMSMRTLAHSRCGDTQSFPFWRECAGVLSGPRIVQMHVHSLHVGRHKVSLPSGHASVFSGRLIPGTHVHSLHMSRYDVFPRYGRASVLSDSIAVWMHTDSRPRNRQNSFPGCDHTGASSDGMSVRKYSRSRCADRQKVFPLNGCACVCSGYLTVRTHIHSLRSNTQRACLQHAHEAVAPGHYVFSNHVFSNHLSQPACGQTIKCSRAHIRKPCLPPFFALFFYFYFGQRGHRQRPLAQEKVPLSGVIL